MKKIDELNIEQLTEEYENLEKEYENVKGWEGVNAIARQQLNIRDDIRDILLKNNITIH